MANRKSKKRGKFFFAVFFVLLMVLLIPIGKEYYYDSRYPREYAPYVEEFAQKYSVDEDLIYAVIKTESSFNPNAVSKDGAKGLMQVTSETFDWLSMKMGYEDLYVEDDLFQPEVGIEYGTFFLSYLLDEFGDVETVAAAYHAGRGITNRWLEDSEYSSDGKTLDYIPYKDTSHYVNKIVKHYEIYQKRSSSPIQMVWNKKS